MSRKKKIIISILSLALCILVTFAWINELQNPEGRVMALRFNDAAVASSELEIKLSVDVGNDVFDDITKISEGEDPQLAQYNDFAPGARKKFRIDITNYSKSSVSLRVLLSDIICEGEELQQSVIIGTNGFAGFTGDYPAPAVQTKMLSEGMDGAGGFVLVENVEIPPNNIDKPISIYFYVMLAASGSENLENQSFSIGTINFINL